jgi:hypothetical protein
MKRKSIPVREACQFLRNAGYPVVQRPAPAGMCRTLCYRLEGQPFTINGIRAKAVQVARDHGDHAALRRWGEEPQQEA